MRDTIRRRTTGAVAAFAMLGATAAVAPEATAAAKRPDLRVVKVANPPAKADPGKAFSTKVTVRNAGSATAGASSVSLHLSRDVRKGAGDLSAGSASVGKLAKGRSATAKGTVRIPSSASGSYYVIACADSRGKVKESSEKNNCSPSGTTVQVAGDVSADIAGTLTFTDTGQVTQDGESHDWDRSAEVRLNMSIDGPRDDPEFADTGSSYGYEGAEERRRGGTCPWSWRRDEAGEGGFVYTGDPFTDDIYGQLARVDFTAIRIGLTLGYDQTTVIQDCDFSDTSSGRAINTVSIRFEKVASTASSITLEATKWEADMGTTSNWDDIEGKITLSWN